MIVIREKFSATSRRISLFHSDSAAIALRDAYCNPSESVAKEHVLPIDLPPSEMRYARIPPLPRSAACQSV